MSHNSHTNHSNHKNHSNHSNTGHGVVSLTWTSWGSGIVSNSTTFKDAVPKLKELRNNIQKIKDNKGPTAMPSIDLTGIADSTMTTGSKFNTSQYETLRTQLDILNKKVYGSNTGLPAKAKNNIIYANDFNNLKTKTQNLAAKNTHASTGSYSSHTSYSSAHSNSDIRLKTDIKELDYGLEELLKINPVRYRWLENGSKDIGVIAQEIREIVPEIVLEDKDGYLKVDYSKLSALIIKSIQELHSKINKD